MLSVMSGGGYSSKPQQQQQQAQVSAAAAVMMHSSTTTYTPLTIDSTYGHLKHEPQPMHYERDAGEESPTSSDSGGCHRGSKASNGRPNRDPLSHRIIEKRRRDRMNNCLTNLSKMIPSHFLKKGRGRVEKTEIIEMAIRYMQQLHEERRSGSNQGPEPVCFKPLLTTTGATTHTASNGTVVSTYPVRPVPVKREETVKREDKAVATDVNMTDIASIQAPPSAETLNITALKDRYKQGYFDCIAETLRFLAIAEGLPINESTKTQLLFHLREYFSRSTYDVLGTAFSDLLAVAQQQYPPAVIVPQPHTAPAPAAQAARPSPMQPAAAAAVEPVSPCSSDQPLNMSTKASSEQTRLRSMLSVPPPPHQHQQQQSQSQSQPTPTAKDHTSSSGTYPSSPGSSRSLSGVSSTNSYAPDSPPRVLSPQQQRQQQPHKPQQREVPVFALHASGQYYVPLNLSTGAMRDDVVGVLSRQTSTGNSGAGSQCHPVTIPVNFTAANGLQNNK